MIRKMVTETALGCAAATESNQKNKNPKTFRFVFSKEFMDVLNDFSKVHQHDDRKVFTESWNIWIEESEIKPMIENEISILSHNGFKGDIMDKMFKSARYYFRKKPTEKEPKEKERKEYIGGSPKLLESMDTHIKEELIKTPNISPANSYINYCINNQEYIMEEILLFKSRSIDNTVDADEMKLKLKKTYKNRFYNQKVKLAP
jgi:hypothetical protein